MSPQGRQPAYQKCPTRTSKSRCDSKLQNLVISSLCVWNAIPSHGPEPARLLLSGSPDPKSALFENGEDGEGTRVLQNDPLLN